MTPTGVDSFSGQSFRRALQFRCGRSACPWGLAQSLADARGPAGSRVMIPCPVPAPRRRAGSASGCASAGPSLASAWAQDRQAQGQGPALVSPPAVLRRSTATRSAVSTVPASRHTAVGCPTRHSPACPGEAVIRGVWANWGIRGGNVNGSFSVGSGGQDSFHVQMQSRGSCADARTASCGRARARSGVCAALRC
jgi:hypothetical protein